GIHSTLHDVLGWLMPVGAVTLLWGELWMMDCLFVVDDDSPEGQDLNATHPHPDGSTVPIIAHAS
ncbi:MAG: hypothetical protein ACI92S_003811, partial [Planctomycetaceae bacterium]